MNGFFCINLKCSFPALFQQAPSHKYSAHSSHVTNVSFTHNDSHLISTGGKDMSIIQWRLVEKVTLPQNDIMVDMGTTKMPVNPSESFVQSSTSVPLAHPFDETVVNEGVVDAFPSSLEDNLEQTVEANEEQSEEQSEGSSLDPGEPNCEDPSNETSEEQSESTITEDQPENSPVS